MKSATLLHNPTAGDEGHEQEDLKRMVEKAGYLCRYSSTKEKDWKDFEGERDFLIVAGGDGTVRKVVKALLNRKMIAKTWPVALLPLGTANNIAKTLDLEKEPQEIIAAWKENRVKRFDVGCVYTADDSLFFLESFGYGLFPYLMKEMKKKYKDEEPESPEAKIKAALTLLHQLVLSYEPRYCRLIVDGVDHSGNYLLAELMNTQSIGPNLLLAPNADPGDGLLDVVVLPEGDKAAFAQYVLDKINGRDETYNFSRLQGRNITISWTGTHVHIDDEVLKLEEEQLINIELKKQMLEFIVA